MITNDTCYILALFKRDDGERLLLGSGYYPFADSQKHFAANAFANDVLELQGTDGQLLTGQVRRSQSQPFDGFIGDGTTIKTIVEQKRREFFLFFRKQHHYTVVYIMPDGTAIKRDRGYITDAPAVQELYQVQPKYHIALAFEDVNYYSYAEDASGNEIFSFNATLGLANIEDGGLVWDANGAISDNTGLKNIKILGDTDQQGTPTPSSPVAIQTVTGTQTIAINGTNYSLDLGVIELCKLGTYQDYIWKDGNDWKVHKETGKYTFDGTESWSWDNTIPRIYYSQNQLISLDIYPVMPANTSTRPTALTTKFSGKTFVDFYTNQQSNGFAMSTNGKNWNFGDKTWAHSSDGITDITGTTVYYALLSAYKTDTAITDAALIAQLEAIAEAMAEDGRPTTITATGQNLPATITGEPNGIGGYIFAASTGGGPINVTVNGVDSANPVWHVVGPATNPTLTNSTTGEALVWNGTVPNNQELIIDMGAQTATMEGANVFEYVSGSWIQLAPGINRVSYTAANTTKSSTIYWNEVVG